MTRPGRRAWLAAAALLLPWWSAAAMAVESQQARTYEDCMTLARQKPDEGFELALEWRDHGGGLAAEHCAAVALMGQKDYAEAAERLGTLATEMIRESPGMRAEVLSQAADGWSKAGQPKNAEAALDEALRLTPRNADFLVDRAAARADQQHYNAAVADLSDALTLGASRGEILALRAAAYRQSGDLRQAAADADAAVTAAPDLPEALLERGNVRRLTGNNAGARQDWLTLLRAAPDGPAADAARDNLATLDVRIKPGEVEDPG